MDPYTSFFGITNLRNNKLSFNFLTRNPLSFSDWELYRTLGIMACKYRITFFFFFLKNVCFILDFRKGEWKHPNCQKLNFRRNDCLPLVQVLYHGLMKCPRIRTDAGVLLKPLSLSFAFALVFFASAVHEILI